MQYYLIKTLGKLLSRDSAVVLVGDCTQCVLKWVPRQAAQSVLTTNDLGCRVALYSMTLVRQLETHVPHCVVKYL